MSSDKPIRHVQPLDPLSSEIVSTPTVELEKRLKILENSIASLAAKGSISNVVIKNRKIHNSVDLYNTVYYNSGSGLYEPTLAKVEFTGNSYQTLPTAMVVGVVVKIVGNTADILVDGSWPSAVFKTAGNKLLEPGETYQPGKPYYVSSEFQGRITSRPPALAVQVLLATDDNVLMNKVYGTPEGFEKTSKFEMGMRPVGSTRTVGNESRVVGFDALESDALDGVWTDTKENAKFSDSGYMVAEGEALGVAVEPVWIELIVSTEGHISIGTASSLAQLSDPDINVETFSTESYEAEDRPFAVTADNHEDTRTYVVTDSNNVPLQRIYFKFICNEDETFDLDNYRSVILRIPDSLQGWKEIDTSGIEAGASGSKYQIQPYYLEDGQCDYPDYEHVPTDVKKYYDTKSDFGFVQNWPAEPLNKAIIMVNGTEMTLSEINEQGVSSNFGDDYYDLGISTKTAYWGTAYVETQPWDINYSRLVSAEDGIHNSSSEVTHRNSSPGSSWFWKEATYSFEPHVNRSWVYTNKLSVYHKSSRVLGVGVLPPLRVKDVITGLEPSYDGEPMSGNLLLWSEDQENVSHTTPDVHLGRFSTTPIYTNNTKFNVVLRELIFIVRSQNNSQRSNIDLGQTFDESDYALVDVGTGSEGAGVYNILHREPVKVLEYNTSCVLTLSEKAAIVPPNGVVRINVYRPFDVEQRVSVIVTGKVF